VSDSDGSRPSDTMQERVSGSSRTFWLLLDANRQLVAAAISGGVFLALAVVGHLHPTGAQALFGRGDPIETLFQGLLTAIITGVTLVLTLSQLVLSQEQGPVGDQRERMAGAMSFRRDVEAVIEEPVSPAQPSAFLRSLVQLTERHADAVSDAVREIDDETVDGETAGEQTACDETADDETLDDGTLGDESLDDQVAAFTENLKRNAEAVRHSLDGAQFGEFDVVAAALNYNYSWKLYAARRIRAEHADHLTEDAHRAFDDLVDALELFGPAREHFKTLYFQWALVDLSRAMLYASVPALLTAVAGIVYLDPALFPATAFGVRPLVVVVSAGVAVSLLPFAFLFAYILRIVTVAKRTLSIGPFILRETDRSRDLDWSDSETARSRDAGGEDE